LTELPTSIGKLNQLEMLSIYGNQLKYLPENIGNLTQLKVLSVHHNQLTNLPASIGKLASLRVLRAHYNKICDLPASIGQLKYLKQLNLRANKLMSLPTSIRQINSLSLFDIEKNEGIYVPKSLYDWVSANYNGLSPTIRDRVHESKLKKLQQQILREKENQALQDAQKRRNQTFWLLAASSLTVFVVILITSKNARKEKQAKQQIDTQAKQLAAQNNKALQQTQALQDNIAALTELQEFRRKVWAMITHDLKNPLDIIIGLSETSISHKNLTMIQEAVQRMTQLIEGLLKVRNIKDIQLPHSMDCCQLSALIEESLAQVHWLAQAKNITINYAKVPIEVKADFVLITRVLVNLLNNAIKYSQAYQTIAIETIRGKQHVSIVITDEGVGISQAQQASIFEEYYQVNPQKTFQTRPTGLGLAFCKMVIEAHQGNIGVKSNVGRGSSFWFTLPLVNKTFFAPNFSTNLLPLTAAERQHLKPYLTLLKQQTVYQFTRVDNILAQIDTRNNENIDKWVKAVRDSLETCCENTYKQLIN
jgi:signal transduction histidine kinase